MKISALPALLAVLCALLFTDNVVASGKRKSSKGKGKGKDPPHPDLVLYAPFITLDVLGQETFGNGYSPLFKDADLTDGPVGLNWLRGAAAEWNGETYFHGAQMFSFFDVGNEPVIAGDQIVGELIGSYDALEFLTVITGGTGEYKGAGGEIKIDSTQGYNKFSFYFH